jgi:hypothetical protein
LVVELAAPAAVTDLLLSFGWSPRNEAGHYIRIAAEQYDREGRLVGSRQASIVGPRTGVEPVVTLFHLHRNAQRIRLELSNAYHAQMLRVQRPVASWLAAPTAGPPHHPAGQVGLIAAAPEYIPDLLREMIEHYAHYRSSAQAFARVWKTAHACRRTVEILQARGGRAPGAA